MLHMAFLLTHTYTHTHTYKQISNSCQALYTHTHFKHTILNAIHI